MRLLLESQNCYRNMAEDEALIKTKSEPTLRLYTWEPSAVSIGYFQSIKDEVDVNFCRKNGIDIVRRNTGGGAVFHDEKGELTYSLIYPLSEWNKFAESVGREGNNIMETYRIVCNCLIIGLEKLGIEADFKPINDIETSGKKDIWKCPDEKGGIPFTAWNTIIFFKHRKNVQSSKSER